MAVEVIDLCPEKVNLVDNVKITSKGLRSFLEGASLPFNLGSRYVLVPQLNHAQKTPYEGKYSQRFVAVEIVDGEAKSIRTILLSNLSARVLGFVESGVDAPEVKVRKNEAGLYRPDGAKYTPCVNQRLPLDFTPEERGRIYAPCTLVAKGVKECYTPRFEAKGDGFDMVLNSRGTLDLDTTFHNFWEVVQTNPKDAKIAKDAVLKSKFSSFIQ